MNEPSAGLNPADVDLLLTVAGIQPKDRTEVAALLLGEPSAEARRALAELQSRLGVVGAPVLPEGVASDHQWLWALMAFIPEQLQWYASQGIPEQVAHESLADIGRQLAVSRVVKGEFSLETWKWLGHQATGTLLQLGRLQFQICPGPEDLPGIRPGEAVLETHIPESGPLSVEAVADSFRQAGTFFAEHFPALPVRFATCTSWLLDPYLADRLGERSNITRFARLFTLWGGLEDTPGDAVYFTFRTRDAADLALAPRETSLQRTVLERIEAGGQWQVGRGYLELDRF
ncbi:acyltransferase domain-containing protein [Psychromicrobium xiongbiense]|uniref:acyltransferase domain-containing protein n=1 Tax=Psychromicrobium xiongbiense TaxID=3051184 RepID=UPI002552630B|nr:acyltransferase domain-containing protein [Psychromicrobium sp. YIM S02556]